ncbi:2-phosphosulfolactate phosphatase [Streptomyces cavernicola]|uniref:Probable 2-phosphosulfolactate phosphatase n=1 Tax=Streptomyces cavernicola TaxID=3043613 RepID=A0ABT6S3R5_9ACTN|nr:2-phosphosulfolactate phosphatase [Streptomyces sp. B-S-A6]MDI3402740.1 2-phosphosulfolactate phosphatase [Streptomyces sp. B-S-A6]
MSAGSDWFTQAGHGVRFEWGPAGAGLLAQDAACLVVVDVLSFTTAVTVAVEAGTKVFPYRWRDATAQEFADEVGARLAVGRRMADETSPWSLSPAALRRAPFASRLVLPSPNGSSIAAAAGESTVVAGALRNASAVGRWLAGSGFGTAERPVLVVASGERWPDGSLRPALEDLLGAGAVIAALHRSGRDLLSPEAAMASAAYESVPDIAATLAACASGRELIAGGYADDVAVAAESDACEVVPVLIDGAFAAARWMPRAGPLRSAPCPRSASSGPGRRP